MNLIFRFQRCLSSKSSDRLRTIYDACMKIERYPLDSGLLEGEDTPDNYLLAALKTEKTHIAYAALYRLEDSILIYAFVHPDYRRLHLFKSMVERIQKRYPHMRLDFAANEGSPAVLHMIESGQFLRQETQFLLTYNLKQFYKSENTCDKIISDNGSGKVSLNSSSGLSMKRTQDVEMLSTLHSRIFKDFPSRDISKIYIESMRSLEGIQPFIFEDGDKYPVGMCMLLTEGKQACLAAFGILPEYQDRGLGRSCLKLLCAMLIGKNLAEDLMVQVDGNNTAALKLYTSFGFTKRETFSTYSLSSSVKFEK